MDKTTRFRIGVARFEQVYDPSVGEDVPWYINDHTFVRDRLGMWHLFGITHPEPLAPFDELSFAHATAPTLHGPWEKQAFALTADADHGELHLWAPHVIEHDDRYWMFYCAGGASKDRYRIHLATSTDCWTWTRHPSNPLIVDGFEARDPMVMRLGDQWVMYYTATSEPDGGHFVVCASASPDLVNWSGRTIVYQDPMTGTMAGPTESPFVIADGNRYLLLIGPDWEGILERYVPGRSFLDESYRSTRVLASEDPMHFSLADQIGTVEAHAAEIVVDDAGLRWVSHCGWGQGGVYLAPFDLDCNDPAARPDSPLAADEAP